MPSFFRSAAVMAMMGAAMANPLKRDDACLAAVTGKAALGDDGLRKEHCSSFIKTIVTPSAITVTTTITDAPATTEWSNYKRDVTVCPNEVPNYASACDEAGYKSACNAYGVFGETTVTIPATTSTKTVYVGKGGNGGSGATGVCTSTSTEVFSITKTGCSGGTTTSTVTETATLTPSTITITAAVNATAPVNATTPVSTITVTVPVNATAPASTITITATLNATVAANATVPVSTVTVTATVNATISANATVTTPTVLPTTCLSDSKAQEFVDAFVDLLQYTSYNGSQGAPGRGYHYNVSAQYLAEDFKDYSDSINWMAGFPLGGVTFDGRAAFDYGQGILQPELSMDVKFVHHSCNDITWKWVATTQSGASVTGINHMIISDDFTQITENHAEFDNAAWLYSFGLQCKVASTTSNTTATS